MSALTPKPEPPALTPSLRREATLNRFFAGGLLVSTALLFWPVTRWLLQEAVGSQQIRQAFLVLGVAAALVAWDHRRVLRPHLDLGNRALTLLTAAYGCVVAVWLTHITLLLLPAFALGLAGCLHLGFGPEGWRFLRPLFAGFVACLLVILLFPLLDWPLRQMAGVNAARVLHAIGFTPQLQVELEPAPRLLLHTGLNVFEVATECNGFGLITTSVVLALLAAGIADRSRVTLLWLLPVAATLGFTFNLLRILGICLLAPYFPGHYHAMHETIGTIALWSDLALVGWLAWHPKEKTAATQNH